MILRAIAIGALLSAASHSSGHASYRKQPCKTPELAPSCFQIHARLSAGNGTPSVRLWGIGTHHTYGIYSNKYGFVHDGEIDALFDNEAPELPQTVRKQLPPGGGWTIYGDFEVCPLEPHVEGRMQAACIAGGSHIVKAY